MDGPIDCWLDFESRENSQNFNSFIQKTLSFMSFPKDQIDCVIDNVNVPWEI